MSLFWPPGRPKRSIVANLAPKMTPTWSPKWSQSDNARPLRNMHRHCRIAYPPPFGELLFHCFFRVRKKVTKNPLHGGTILKFWCPNGPKVTRLGPILGAHGLLTAPWEPLGCLCGAPGGPRSPKRDPQTPKIKRNHQTTMPKAPKKLKNTKDCCYVRPCR